MTDLRARLIAALKDAAWPPYATFDQIADVLLSLPGIAIVKVPEVATIPTKDAMLALIGEWHDAHEAGCCGDEDIYCPESTAYAQGYLAALAATGL